MFSLDTESESCIVTVSISVLLKPFDDFQFNIVKPNEIPFHVNLKITGKLKFQFMTNSISY